MKVMGTLQGNNSIKAVTVNGASECAIFGDGEFELGANKYMRSPQAGKLDETFGDTYRYAGTQGYRHCEATNVAYCDGSARAVRDIYAKTASKGRIEEHNKTHKVKIGFISKDNSAYDLK